MGTGAHAGRRGEQGRRLGIPGGLERRRSRGGAETTDKAKGRRHRRKACHPSLAFLVISGAHPGHRGLRAMRFGSALTQARRPARSEGTSASSLPSHSWIRSTVTCSG